MKRRRRCAISEAESIRLIAEVLALLSFVGSAAYWIVRQIWRVLHEVTINSGITTGLAKHIEILNGSVAEHLEDDAMRFEHMGKQLSHIEGTLEERAKVADAAAAAAIKLADSTARAATKLAEATAATMAALITKKEETQ